jgi:hypothetical protein
MSSSAEPFPTVAQKRRIPCGESGARHTACLRPVEWRGWLRRYSVTAPRGRLEGDAARGAPLPECRDNLSPVLDQVRDLVVAERRVGGAVELVVRRLPQLVLIEAPWLPGVFPVTRSEHREVGGGGQSFLVRPLPQGAHPLGEARRPLPGLRATRGLADHLSEAATTSHTFRIGSECGRHLAAADRASPARRWVCSVPRSRSRPSCAARKSINRA